MRWRINDRELLLRYLAGELTPHETKELDERLLSDDDFLDRLEEVRNDLVDAYTAGDLRQDQKERLEKALRESPAQRSRLHLARALAREHPAGRARAQAAGKPPGRGFLWQPVVAAICVAVAVTAVLYLRSHSELKNLSIAEQSRASSTPPRARTKPAEPSHSAARMPSTQPAFALLLGTGVERGLGPSRSLVLPRGLKKLEVQILLPSGESGKRYEVEVALPHHSDVKTFSGLSPEEVFSQKLVQFAIPVAELPSGLYSFRLYREGRVKKILLEAYQTVITHESDPSQR